MLYHVKIMRNSNFSAYKWSSIRTLSGWFVYLLSLGTFIWHTQTWAISCLLQRSYIPQSLKYYTALSRKILWTPLLEWGFSKWFLWTSSISVTENLLLEIQASSRCAESEIMEVKWVWELVSHFVHYKLSCWFCFMLQIKNHYHLGLGLVLWVQ